MKMLRLATISITLLVMQSQLNCGWLDRRLGRGSTDPEVIRFLNDTNAQLSTYKGQIAGTKKRFADMVRKRQSVVDMQTNIENMSYDIENMETIIVDMCRLFIWVIAKYSDDPVLQSKKGFEKQVDELLKAMLAPKDFVVYNKEERFNRIIGLMDLEPRPTNYEINQLIAQIEKACTEVVQTQRAYMKAREDYNKRRNEWEENLDQRRRDLDAQARLNARAEKYEASKYSAEERSARKAKNFYADTRGHGQGYGY